MGPTPSDVVAVPVSSSTTPWSLTASPAAPPPSSGGLLTAPRPATVAAQVSPEAIGNEAPPDFPCQSLALTHIRSASLQVPELQVLSATGTTPPPLSPLALSLPRSSMPPPLSPAQQQSPQWPQPQALQSRLSGMHAQQAQVKRSLMSSALSVRTISEQQHGVGEQSTHPGGRLRRANHSKGGRAVAPLTGRRLAVHVGLLVLGNAFVIAAYGPPPVLIWNAGGSIRQFAQLLVSL